MIEYSSLIMIHPTTKKENDFPFLLLIVQAVQTLTVYQMI